MRLEDFENQLRVVVSNLEAITDSANDPTGYVFTYKGVELSLKFSIERRTVFKDRFNGETYLEVGKKIKIRGIKRYFSDEIEFTDKQIEEHLPEILDLMAVLYKDTKEFPCPISRDGKCRQDMGEVCEKCEHKVPKKPLDIVFVQ